MQGVSDAGVRPSSGVWFVTRGGQVLERERSGALSGSALWGFGSAAGLEHGDLRPRLLDLDPVWDPEAAKTAAVVADELLFPDRETRVAWRSGRRRVARLVRSAGSAELPPGAHWRLARNPDGALDQLRVEPTPGGPLGASEIRVDVEAAGVNFLDVMSSMGLVDAVETLGAEFCGRVVEVGVEVDGLSAGDRVVGFAPGAFGPEVVTRAAVVAPAPSGFGPAALATIPVAYATAALAFEFAGAPSDGSAWLGGNCSLCGLRGGSWYNSPGGLRAAYRRAANRNWNATGSRNNINGFRVARTLTP